MATTVMTQSEFVAMLQTAQSVPNYYNNTGGHNLGQFDGQKYSFDCWNLIKAILSGWTPTTPTQRPLVTGDVAGETLLKDCGVTFGQTQDFNQLSIPGTYLYMNGHAGTYIGDVYDTSGHHYNVIECTAWSARGHDLGDSGQLTSININEDGTPKGVIYTYITSTGQRRAYEGGRIGGQWANFGLLPWIKYEGYYPPSTVESSYSGTLAPVQPTSYTNVSGPLSTSENILKRMVLQPRFTPPVLYASGSVYEDGSTNGTYEETTVDANGVATVVTRTRRVKYDGRDMWYAPGGWSPFNGALDNASYAWCRFSEAMDSDPNNLLIGHVGCQLSRGMACDMYRHDEDGYIRNVACSLGAVMCFYSKKNPDDGYVCIVEEMQEDGHIRTSEWVGGRFQVVDRQKRYGSWDFDNYVFQGFIHNPACAMAAIAESALDTFCNTALEAVGESVSWIREHTDISANNSYSAGLIVAVSKVSGSTLNIIIPNTVSVTGIGRIGVLQNMGTWVNGPANKERSQPEVGDIVIIRTQQYKKPNLYQGDLAGIVVEIDADDTFSAVQVSGTTIIKKRYKTSLARIAGYFRPNWEQIDGTTDSVKLYRNLHGLYTDGVTIEDACAREVCYLKDNLPSIKRSDIKLSAINYTGLLSNMYSVFATSSTSDAADTDLIVDLWTNTIKSWFQDGGTRLVTESASVVRSHQTNNIPSTYTSVEYMIENLTALTGIEPSNFSISNSARIAYAFFTETAGLNPAASCGVLANIQGESHFDCAAAGDYMWKCRRCGTWNSPNVNICTNDSCGALRGSTPTEPTSFGICQWHFGRGDRMKAAAGPNWASNLTGQLEYLLSELRSGYLTTYTAISQVSNDIYGAMYAADIFVRKFEVPANPDKASAARQGHAMTFWQGLVQ